MANHVFRDKDRHELATIVDGQGQSHHLGNNRRAPGPGFDHLGTASSLGSLDLFDQFVIDELCSQPLSELKTIYERALPNALG